MDSRLMLMFALGTAHVTRAAAGSTEADD